MKPIFQACSSKKTILRSTSALLILTAMLGCSDAVQDSAPTTSQAAAPANPIQQTATPAENAAEAIDITIEMAVPDQAMGEFLESSRLFVIAKSAESPIPLAVKAFPLDAIPTSLRLSDADAMMPNRLLSSAKQLQVSARISRAGGVTRAPGDWEGLAAAPSPDSPRQYLIRIDQPVN